MKRNLIVSALIGLFTASSVSAQTAGWSSKVSPLLRQQVVEQQATARRAPGREATENYVGALVKLAEGQDGSFYDLQGRRVASGQLRKGLYIHNGKKVILK